MAKPFTQTQAGAMRSAVNGGKTMSYFRCDICNEEVRGYPANTNRHSVFKKGDRVCKTCRNSISSAAKEKEYKSPARVSMAVAANTAAPCKFIEAIENDETPLFIQEPKTQAEESQEDRPPKDMVYICSPYRGDIETNTANARRYCRYAFDEGFHPFAPHLYYPQFLNEDNPKERAAGLHYALMEMWRMKELWIFGDKRTEGMSQEIELAVDLDIPIRTFSDNGEIRHTAYCGGDYKDE